MSCRGVILNGLHTHPPHDWPAFALLAVVLTIAVITDISKQKIYNWLTLPAFAAGFTVNVFQSHLSGLVFSVEGTLVACLWFGLFLLRGATGAGDVKLFLAVGAFMGPSFTLYTLLYSALTGGVIAIVYSLYRGILAHTVKNALLGAHVFATVQSPEGFKGMADQSKAGKIPYAPAIAIGVVIEWVIAHHS